MRILNLSTGLTVALFFVIWPIFQFTAFHVASKIFDCYLSPYAKAFRPLAWEKNGEIYNSLFRIHRWKRYLPDGGAIVKKDFNKKKLASFSKANLEKFLEESCRAELSHFIAITPFWLFGFIAPIEVVPFMLIYALAANVPCIMAQRYNRPRIERVLRQRP